MKNDLTFSMEQECPGILTMVTTFKLTFIHSFKDAVATR